MSENNHATIIDSFGPVRQLSIALGVPYEAVRGWRNRSRIPGEYWAAMVEAYRIKRVYLTLDMLADGSDFRHKKTAAA